MAFAMEQRVGDFEIAIDAPWRMEPRLKPPQLCQSGQNCGSGTPYTYGAIPINIAILDAFLPRSGVTNSRFLQRAWQAMERDDISYWSLFIDVIKSRNPATNLNALLTQYPNMILEDFQLLTVYEEIEGRFVQRASYQINQLHEVERTTGFWKWSANSANPPTRPTRDLCRRWQGASCTFLSGLRNSSEWYGIAMYQPLNKTPGTNVKLKLELTLGTSTRRLNPGTRDTNTFTQYVNIHLGEAPLPKFNQNWYYGDIHYHSQGTDNDGESGYSYRSALQAMSALGLDFAFATDHASDSKQIISAAPGSDYPGSLQGLGPLTPGVLRDLSSDRFAHNIGIVNNESGANRQVTSYPRKLYQPLSTSLPGAVERSLVTPQLFLGAEVDVIAEVASNKIPPFPWGASCTALSPWLIALDQGFISTATDRVGEALFPSGQESFQVCDPNDLLQPLNDGRSLIKDVQGPDGNYQLSKGFYGRQHVLHLPEDPQKTDAFISSKTSKYGGATRRLKDILNSEFTSPNGILFLAHPLSTASGDGIERLGPDIMPYSEASLLDAFRSKHVLGLQLWNENHHFKSDMGTPIPTWMKELLNSDSYVPPTQEEILLAIEVRDAHTANFIADIDEEEITQEELRKARQILDESKYNAIKNKYGDAISTRPDKSLASDYKPSGLTGELIPVKDLKNWQHQTVKMDTSFGKKLRMWDSMLMWGLDPSLTSSIDWLPQGEPRKVFMAGGSDAHGDYNYMRHGYFTGINSISDGAMGSPRNLVFAGSPQGSPIMVGQDTGTPVSQKQIVDAFRDGNFIVTDGPIIRLAYDKNGNGIIDPQDIPMGGLAKIGGSPKARHINFPLLVEWKSTPEFGPVKEIDLEIGVFSDHYSNGWFYRPWKHPSAEKPFKIPGVTELWREKKTGRMIYQLIQPRTGSRGEFKYQFADPSADTIMTLDISAAEAYAGIRKINVNPQDFPIATAPYREHFYKQSECDAQSLPVFGLSMQLDEKAIASIVNNKATLNTKSITPPKGTGVVYKKQQDGYRVDKPKLGNIGDLDILDDGPGGPNIPDGPVCSFTYFEKPMTADRMYIRAELKGKLKGEIPYKAFTNPIWFNIDGRYAVAGGGPVVTFPDKIVEIITKKSCSAASNKTCQSKKASCEVLSDRKGSVKDVCRWRSVKTATQCKKTVGIWTTLKSKYAQNHPKAISSGRKGACITEVKNIQKVFFQRIDMKAIELKVK